MFPIQVPTPGQESSSDCGYSEIKTLKVIGLVAKGRAKSGSLLQIYDRHFFEVRVIPQGIKLCLLRRDHVKLGALL